MDKTIIKRVFNDRFAEYQAVMGNKLNEPLTEAERIIDSLGVDDDA